MPELKKCFVIAPIGEDNSDTRKRSNQILKHIIEPITKSLAMKPLGRIKYQNQGRSRHKSLPTY